MASYPKAKLTSIRQLVVLLVVLLPVFAFLFAAMWVEMLAAAATAARGRSRAAGLTRARVRAPEFRTLRRDALARIGAESHARMHEGDEKNLTWAGRRLLKPWYLDELPQLWTSYGAI